MAVQTPYSLNFPRADAREQIELTWINGGDLQSAFEIEVYVNDGSASPFYTIGKTPGYAGSVKIPVNKLINGVEYKWRVRIYNAVGSVSAWSDYSLIIASARPTVTITNASGTLYAQRYTFIGTYAQANSVAIKSYRFCLYLDGELTQESEWTYSNDIKAAFVLETDKSYEIELEALSQYDVYGISVKYPFVTSYQKPSQSQGIIATNDKERAAVRLQWRNPTVITLPTLKQPQYKTGVYGQALDLSDGNAVWYSADFNGQSTVMFWAIPSVGSTQLNGVFAKVRNTYREFVEVGFDGATKRFYCRVKNKAETIVRGSSVKSFNANTPIFIAFTQTDCYVGINGVFERF